MTRPLYVYDNWSAYDELSDNVQLTEALAMQQFAGVCRLRRLGVQIDAYLMDAFWYAPDGGYLDWRSDRWPNGPEPWLEACAREGILPGLWFPANTAFHFEVPHRWRDSLAANGWGFSCVTGGFLAGFLEVLEHWYAKGVRVFKFDFAEFSAVPAGTSAEASEEVRRRNIAAYRSALSALKARHGDVVLLAYNGFEHTEYMPWSDRPARPVLDRSWLDCFDTVYCGDPRPSDSPLANFWRTTDVYADAMIHLLQAGSDLKLAEIDNCAFMIGNCGTCYRRGSEAWRTTALLSFARGGRVHVTMGNLENLLDEDALWLARVQALYASAGEPAWVGGDPGRAMVYGYAAGPLLTLVNPGLESNSYRVDAGFSLIYSDGAVRHDGEMVHLGSGSVGLLTRENAASRLEAATSPSISLERLETVWTRVGQALEAEVDVPEGVELHLAFLQRDANGLAVRTSGGSPPDGTSSANLLRIRARHNGIPITVDRPDDKILWSGISWAYAIAPASPTVRTLQVRFETDEPAAVQLHGAAFQASRIVHGGSEFRTKDE